jgi:Ca2+-binding RTX toxin-like protein
MRLLLNSLITGAAVILLFSLDQTSWAALIFCPHNVVECNGTPNDDMILAHPNGNIIHGLGGNDYIISFGLPELSFMYGDDGNDRLIGSDANDGLYGGPGNDYYDGGFGSDSIVEIDPRLGILVFSDDVISGGQGDDFIFSALGSDRIHGGPGNDIIRPDGYHRDFSFDTLDCGSGTGDQVYYNSGDGDTTVNCEQITDFDR